MKIFRTGSPAVVRECQQNFNFLPIELHLEIRTAKFLQAFLRQRIHYACCSNSVQSRSLMVHVYLSKYIQNTPYLVLVNWHAHYVVNNELICSTFAPFSCVLCLIFLCVCLFCFSIIATSFLVNTRKGEYYTLSATRLMPA